MTRRRVLLVVLALLLVGIGWVAWTLGGLPPVRFLLRYGLSPGCEPTGQTLEVEGVTFVEIGPGIFRMGSTLNARGGDWLGTICAPFGLPWGKRPTPSSAMPVHWVEFRRGFWIATTEITNAQYERFNSKYERRENANGDDFPIVDVSWEDAKQYCAWLSKKAERLVRLPSESEWECACRGGTSSEYCFGDKEESLGKYAWYSGNSNRRVHPVAGRDANRWGLYDLHGNVWEWCEDEFHRNYIGAPVDGSPWSSGGLRSRTGTPLRTMRGRSCMNPSYVCRSADRARLDQNGRSDVIGFRPAFTPSPE